MGIGGGIFNLQVQHSQKQGGYLESEIVYEIEATLISLGIAEPSDILISFQQV